MSNNWKDGEEMDVYREDGFRVVEITQVNNDFVSVGYPDAKFRVYFDGGGIGSVTVEAHSRHKCKDMCIDIGQLFKKIK